MSNHVHLAVTGQEEGGVSRLMQHVTGQYAHYLRGRLNRRGRLWQSRFYSCFVEELEAKFQIRLRPLPPVPPAKKPGRSPEVESEVSRHAGQSG